MPKIHVPLTLVFILVLPNMHSVSLGFSVNPLSDVRISRSTFPNAVTVFDTHHPLSIVYLTVWPGVYALSRWLTLAIVALVDLSIREHFVACSFPLAIAPKPLKNPSVSVLTNTVTVPLTVQNLTTVYRIIKLEDLVRLCDFDLL